MIRSQRAALDESRGCGGKDGKKVAEFVPWLDGYRMSSSASTWLNAAILMTHTHMHALTHDYMF